MKAQYTFLGLLFLAMMLLLFTGASAQNYDRDIRGWPEGSLDTTMVAPNSSHEAEIAKLSARIDKLEEELRWTKNKEIQVFRQLQRIADAFEAWLENYDTRPIPVYISKDKGEEEE